MRGQTPVVLGSVLVAPFSSDWWNDGAAGPLHLHLSKLFVSFFMASSLSALNPTFQELRRFALA